MAGGQAMTTTDTLALAREALDELERLEKAATHGPWSSDGRKSIKTKSYGGMSVGMYPSIGTAYRTDDAALIAAARNAIPALLADNARLRDEVERLRAVVALAREMRRYCLGTDASTEYMMQRFDAALAALEAHRNHKETS